METMHIGTASPSTTSSDSMRMLSVAIALFLGLFMIVSGFGKLLNVNAFLEVVRSYGIPDRLAYAAALLPPVEILLGLGLVLLIQIKRLALVTAAMIFAFTIAFAYGHFFRGVEDCGCLGELALFQMEPAAFFIRNVVLGALAIFLWLRPPQWSWWPRRFANYAVPGVVGAILFTVSGISSVNPLYQAPEQGGDDFRNSPVSETPLAPFITVSSDSTYLVFVYSTRCPHCWDTIENVKAFQRSGLVSRVIGLTVANDSTLGVFEQRFGTNFETKRISADDMKSITNAVPRSYYIEDGIVRYLWRGGIVSPYTFQAYHDNSTTSQ